MTELLKRGVSTSSRRTIARIKANGGDNGDLDLPEAHIRGDVNAPYKCIGGAIYTMQHGRLRQGRLHLPAAAGPRRRASLTQRPRSSGV